MLLLSRVWVIEQVFMSTWSGGCTSQPLANKVHSRDRHDDAMPLRAPRCDCISTSAAFTALLGTFESTAAGRESFLDLSGPRYSWWSTYGQTEQRQSSTVEARDTHICDRGRHGICPKQRLYNVAGYHGDDTLSSKEMKSSPVLPQQQKKTPYTS